MKRYKLFKENPNYPLYHFTNYWGAINILKQDILKAGYNNKFIINVDNSPVKYPTSLQYISFTRDPDLRFGPIRFTIDREKLSHNYKIESHLDQGYSARTNWALYEAEERVKGDIPDFHKYVKEVGIIKYTNDVLLITQIKDLCKFRNLTFRNFTH
jgi:predicted glycosyl hydrolase (DUF1957 family)